MAPPSAQPGQAPLDQSQQSALAQTLAKTGPPDNPKTLVQRTNPQYQWLSKLHSIRKAFDDCIADTLDDREPDEQVLVTSMRHAVDRLIKGVKGAESSLKLVAETTESFAPDLAMQAQNQLTQMTSAPQVAGAPQLAGLLGGQQQPPVPPMGGMQPPVPGAPPQGAMPPGISAGQPGM